MLKYITLPHVSLIVELSKRCMYIYTIVVKVYSHFRKVKCRVGRNQEFSRGFGQSLARKLQTQGKTYCTRSY